MQVLMLSSSRCGDDNYLETATPLIQSHVPVGSKVLFIPFAGVTISWDDYTQLVQDSLPDYQIEGIHQSNNPTTAIQQADVIFVGGGNTFNLLYQLYIQSLLEPIKHAVNGGTPYVGWSAGSNICGATIRTTNDMPIIEPPSFNALGFLPFQINPHYTDYHPPGHNGETRAQRLQEFCRLNPQTPVVGIKEGGALSLNGNKLTLIGEKDGILFIGEKISQIPENSDLSRLI